MELSKVNGSLSKGSNMVKYGQIMLHSTRNCNEQVLGCSRPAAILVGSHARCKTPASGPRAMCVPYCVPYWVVTVTTVTDHALVLCDAVRCNTEVRSLSSTQGPSESQNLNKSHLPDACQMLASHLPHTCLAREVFAFRHSFQAFVI